MIVVVLGWRLAGAAAVVVVVVAVVVVAVVVVAVVVVVVVDSGGVLHDSTYAPLPLDQGCESEDHCKRQDVLVSLFWSSQKELGNVQHTSHDMNRIMFENTALTQGV